MPRRPAAAAVGLGLVAVACSIATSASASRQQDEFVQTARARILALKAQINNAGSPAAERAAQTADKAADVFKAYSGPKSR